MTEMTPARTGQDVGWTVTAQRETVKILNGQAVPGVEVSFQTAAGTAGSVFVDNARYSVDNVRAAIAARALAMDTIDRLTSGG